MAGYDECALLCVLLPQTLDNRWDYFGGAQYPLRCAQLNIAAMMAQLSAHLYVVRLSSERQRN